jgi:hypothetical protein
LTDQRAYCLCGFPPPVDESALITPPDFLESREVTGLQWSPSQPAPVPNTPKAAKRSPIWMNRWGFPNQRRAFIQRREQIVGDCVQLSADVDAYNDMNSGQRLTLPPVFIRPEGGSGGF